MYRQRRFRPRQQYLDQRKEGVHRVLGDVAPCAEDGREPRRRIEDTPVDDGDDEGVDDDCRVGEGMKGLEETGEARKEGSAAHDVSEGMDGGDEEVE